MSKLQLRLLPDADGRKVANVYFIEVDNRGTWERSQPTAISSHDKEVTEIILGPRERLVIEGGFEYETVIDPENNTATVVKKVVPEPEPELPLAKPTRTAAEHETAKPSKK